jgi:UDP:flavonoid glycosyltransferase YjiC (YdhE family)
MSMLGKGKLQSTMPRMPGDGGALTLLVAAFGDPGHAFPAIALARALRGRGHRVVVETWEKWRGAVEGEGLEFTAAEEYEVFPPPPSDSADGASAADAAWALMPLLEDLRPDAVVSDILTLAPTLAAEVAGCRHVTLIPHVYPVHEPGMPFFAFGWMPPRTGLGRAAWRAGLPALETGLRRGRRELNETRARLGLPPLVRFHGGISEELALVATFPQLEYPRRWPAHVKVVGPMDFELPFPDVELPGGHGPLVLVAPSTSQDPQCRLVRVALEALADEPVRVLATTNRHVPAEPIEVPPNARVVEWVSYSQGMREADLVICHGGHGTVARALGAGVPVLCCPAEGDMAENGARVAWAGVGLSLPWRLTRPGPVRWAVRRLLADPGFTRAAREIGDSAGESLGASVGAGLVERVATGGKRP